jgi:hypothetical protein
MIAVHSGDCTGERARTEEARGSTAEVGTAAAGRSAPKGRTGEDQMQKERERAPGSSHPQRTISQPPASLGADGADRRGSQRGRTRGSQACRSRSDQPSGMNVARAAWRSAVAGSRLRRPRGRAPAGRRAPDPTPLSPRR